MSQEENKEAYLQGLMVKCAEVGISPEELLKHAGAGSKLLEGIAAMGGKASQFGADMAASAGTEGLKSGVKKSVGNAINSGAKKLTSTAIPAIGGASDMIKNNPGNTGLLAGLGLGVGATGALVGGELEEAGGQLGAAGDQIERLKAALLDAKTNYPGIWDQIKMETGGLMNSVQDQGSDLLRQASQMGGEALDWTELQRQALMETLRANGVM